MTSLTPATSASMADDVAIIAVLTTRPASAEALERELSRQLLPHDVHRFEDVDELLAFLSIDTARGNRPVDAVLVDLRKFPGAPAALADRTPAPILVAAYPTDGVEYAVVEDASAAGALLLSGELSERECVLRFTAALVDHWFAQAGGQSLSRKAK